MGDLKYTVLGARWVDRLESATPRNRFLVVRLNVVNKGQTALPLRGLELINAAGERINETTSGVEQVPDHLGILRTLEPAQSDTGAVVFDVPLAAYTLAVPDGKAVEHESVAHIEIPVQVEHPVEEPVQN